MMFELLLDINIFINRAFNKLVYMQLHFYDRWQINTILQ